MKLAHWTCLSVILSVSCMVLSPLGYAGGSAAKGKQGPNSTQIRKHNKQGAPYGPPTLSQKPPFFVPDSGYAVQGRPGLIHFVPNIKFEPWKPFAPSGMPAGLQRKLLSQSPTMGAVSQITYVPPGWKHPAGYHNADNEIFVLEGDLEITDDTGKNQQKLTKYSFSFIPAGVVHTMQSQQGSVLIEWYKGKPDFVAANHNKKGARIHAVVLNWNRFEHPWYIGRNPYPKYRTGGNFPGYDHTLLRKDPDNGAMTWMTFVASIPAPPSKNPGDTFGGYFEIHPSFEEYYLPEGSHYVNDDDTTLHKSSKSYGECLKGKNGGLWTYKTGTRGYFFRAAGVAHGGGRSSVNYDADGNVKGGNGKARWGWTFVRTGTRLWATYVTDCSYQVGAQYMGKDRPWRLYDYNVPRYAPQQ